MLKVVRREEMDAEAAAFVDRIHTHAKATVVLLSGDLGAGKTTFVQSVARALGVKEGVTSPTFVIMKTYALEGTFRRLIHIDAYRLKADDALTLLGWEEILKDPGNLIFIEWPERVSSSVLPNDALCISFGYSDGERHVTYG